MRGTSKMFSWIGERVERYFLSYRHPRGTGVEGTRGSRPAWMPALAGMAKGLDGTD